MPEDNKDSETFAVVLGLKEVPSHFANKYNRDEVGKMLHIRNMTEILKKTQSVDEVNITLAIFCANYLPALVDKFLEPPSSPHLSQDLQTELQLNNGYFQMLHLIRDRLCPYYMKYIRSHREPASKNQVLTKVVTERLLKVAPIWERLGYFQKSPKHWGSSEPKSKSAPPAQVLWVIQHLLTNYVKRADQGQILPLYLRKRLESQVSKWQSRSHGTELEIACLPFAVLMPSENQSWARNARSWVHGWLAAWHVCAVRSCGKKEQDGLKACSRCGTVKYVSDIVSRPWDTAKCRL